MSQGGVRRFVGRRGAGVALTVVMGAFGGACHAPVAPVSAASVRSTELPSDPVELRKLCVAWSTKHDRPSLENALIACGQLAARSGAVSTPATYEGNWMASRAAFWLADEANKDRDRRGWFAKKGVDYAAKAILDNGGGVEGHYYKAMCLGYLAQVRTLGAVELVGQVQKEATAAIAIDGKFDGAGPLRLLGMLLLKAPGWPASIGDPDEGMETLKRAVEAAPDHPLNRLYYGEALIANRKPAEALAQLDEVPRLIADPQWSYMKARVDQETQQQLAKVQPKQR